MNVMPCKKSDWKKGFKYQAFVGYGWVDCIVGVNGFDKKDFITLCNNVERIRKSNAKAVSR